MSQEAWLAGVVAKLTADQSAGTFYEAVGGRIYRHEAPADTALPLAILAVGGDAPPVGFGAKQDIEADFSILLWGAHGSSETTLQSANTKLFDLLHGSSATISGYNGGQMVCLDRGGIVVDDQRVSIISQWRLFATEA